MHGTQLVDIPVIQEFIFCYAFCICSIQIMQEQLIYILYLQKNPTRCKNVLKFYYSIFKLSSTCFGGHTAHHQEPKTAQIASGLCYLTTSNNYTSDNLPCMQNQMLLVQFQAPDDGRCVARNMFSLI
jgi:hypothetical protein